MEVGECGQGGYGGEVSVEDAFGVQVAQAQSDIKGQFDARGPA